MSDNSSRGKLYLISLHFVYVKGNWRHLAQKNNDQDLGSMHYLGCHQCILIVLVLL